jgi:aldehyde dehydrogenase (NAD(P)+)
MPDVTVTGLRHASATTKGYPDLADPEVREGLDRELRSLAGNRARWARLPIGRKLDYVREIRQRVVDYAEEWVRVGVEQKGLDRDSPLVGAEEWLGGPYASLNWLTDMGRTLSLLESGGDLLQGIPVSSLPNGQVSVRVQPGSVTDRLLTPGSSLDVWMQPGVTEWTLRDTMASFYRQRDPSGRLLVVLGAGNVSALPFSDTVYYLFARGDVVVLKMNPVNDVFQPVLEKLLQPLVRDGFLRFVRGGADVGQYLTQHELVEAVHITGSAATHDAVVYGTGEEGARRKAADEPVIDKPVYSELGGVGPTIVVPGPWSKGDLAYQAEHIAVQALHNAGHVCVSAQVLVLPSGWSKRAAAEEAVRTALDVSTPRAAYYPGTQQRLDTLRAHTPEPEVIGGDSRRTFLAGVDPASDHPVFQQEMFAPMLASTHIDGGDPVEYLHNAVTFANDRLDGTLGANILIHPVTARKLGPALRRAIADLRYGNIAINTWSVAIYASARGAWGAHPGHTRSDIQSGTGVVRNTLLFDKPQKNVIRAPFRQYPKPPIFLNHPAATPAARAFIGFLAQPSPLRMMKVLGAAAQR